MVGLVKNTLSFKTEEMEEEISKSCCRLCHRRFGRMFRIEGHVTKGERQSISPRIQKTLLWNKEKVDFKSCSSAKLGSVSGTSLKII